MASREIENQGILRQLHGWRDQGKITDREDLLYEFYYRYGVRLAITGEFDFREEETEARNFWQTPALLELLNNEVQAGSMQIELEVTFESARIKGDKRHRNISELVERLNAIQTREHIRGASTKSRRTNSGIGIFTTRNDAKKFGGDLIYSDDGRGHLIATLTWKNTE